MTAALDRAFHGTGWVPCSSCGWLVPFDFDAFEPWFKGEGVKCGRCHGSVDWCAAVRHSIKEFFAFGHAIALAGGSSTMLSTTLALGETKEVDLTVHGVPAAAEVLHMNVTSAGSATPVLLHGNDAIHPRLGTKFWLFGRAIHAGDGSGPLSVSVVWFVRSQDEPVLLHLVEAAREYGDGRFDAVVIPANVAAEVAIGTAVSKAMSAYGSKDHVADMLQNGATYSHQLNVLLAVAADEAGVPRLADDVRGLLNTLRKRRNEIAHQGRCKAALTREDAADYLAAAIFGVRYGEFLSRVLEARPAFGDADKETTS